MVEALTQISDVVVALAAALRAVASGRGASWLHLDLPVAEDYSL